MPRSQVRALLSQRSAPKTGLGNGDLINCQEPTRGSDDGWNFEENQVVEPACNAGKTAPHQLHHTSRG